MEITLNNAKKVLKKYLKGNKEKLYHSIQVAKVAKMLAEKNEVSVEDAVIASLLHDIGKSMTKKQILNLCASKEVIMYDFDIFETAVALHGKAGAIIFEKEFDRNSDPKKFDEIKHAIASHVAGSDDEMTKLDKIVYIADNIVPRKPNDNLLSKIENEEITNIDDCIRIIIEMKKRNSSRNKREYNPLIDNILDQEQGI